jgi:aryl-alcohol dehydrogenase-like predicted oxidoreductase
VQLPYSLVNRAIEPEFVPMAQALGMGITAWSPVAGGLLTGKYRRTGDGLAGDGRLAGEAAVTAREWAIIETLENVAGELGRPMAQVAINWAATRPGVASVVLGASSARQVESNVAALDFVLPDESRRRLDEVSAVPVPAPYSMFTPEYQSWIVSPGLGIGDKPAGYQRPVLNVAR